MVPTALYPLTKYIEEQGNLKTIEIPKSVAQRRVFFSKGKADLYKGEGIEKLVNVTVKGLLYHYDCGMVYPEKGYVYPVFFYQVIIAPQRILVVTHYAFNDLSKIEEMEGIKDLLQQEANYEEIFLKEFKPQSFIEDDIVPNHFNGLIRTKYLDRAYEAIAKLFNQWHKGMLAQGKSTSQAEIQEFENWFKDFRQKFYQQDYGYTSTKRYMGAKWTKEVFEKHLYTL